MTIHWNCKVAAWQAAEQNSETTTGREVELRRLKKRKKNVKSLTHQKLFGVLSRLAEKVSVQRGA